MSKPIAFIDLASQRDLLRPLIDAAIARVLDHGAFIMSPEVARLEAELSAFAGVQETVGCSSASRWRARTWRPDLSPWRP